MDALRSITSNRFIGTMFRSVVVLLALILGAFADLSFDNGDADKVLLAHYGTAETSVSVLYKGPDAQPVVTGNTLFTTGVVEKTVVDGVTNFTIPFIIINDVGVDEYTITVGDDAVTGKITVAGFVLKTFDDLVVSGEEGRGAYISLTGRPTTLVVKVVNTDGASVDISSTTITPKAVSGPYMKELNLDSASITSTRLTISGTLYRVGTGAFLIEFDAPAITLNGESFETVLRVMQEIYSGFEIPCVAFAGTYQVTAGYVAIPMYNLGVPPLPTPVSEATITVGSTTVTWDTSKSSLDPPDQTVFFPLTEEGTANITCDGKAAFIRSTEVDGVSRRTIEIENNTPATPSPSPPLATTLISELPKALPDQITFETVMKVVKSDPTVLTAPDATAILNTCCNYIGSSGCVITKIVKGSAVMTTQGYINDGKADDADTAIRGAFSSCEFQNKTGYACEDELELVSTSSSSNNLAGGGAAASGMAPWTIALIASIGAFVLVLVIVLSLWFVYRRSAEQSESDYSSSGPLGVPDPSDLLYEQSIVRDIYGRGDFPEGGPSQAVAVQRAREAALREESLRPPSSSGLSRSAHTDEASSTYSV